MPRMLLAPGCRGVVPALPQDTRRRTGLSWARAAAAACPRRRGSAAGTGAELGLLRDRLEEAECCEKQESWGCCENEELRAHPRQETLPGSEGPGPSTSAVPPPRVWF